MIRRLYSKKIVYVVIFLFVGIGIFPTTSGNILKFDNINEEHYVFNESNSVETLKMIYVDDVLRVDQYQRAFIWIEDQESLGILKAQSFKPSKSPLAMVKLAIIKLNDADCDMLVSIREELNGEDLVSKTVSSDAIPDNPLSEIDWGWVDFDILDIEVEIEKTYYIIFKVECMEYSSYFWPGIHDVNDSYKRGSEWYYCEESNSWINPDETYPYCDRAFETYSYGENNPPNIPTIIGPTSGKPGMDYNFTIVTTDPEEDGIYYEIKWGDDWSRVYFTPFTSGEEIIVNHTWSDKGTYTVKVKARDIYGAESDWGTLEISMSKRKAVNRSFLQFIKNLLQNHLRLFPLLRQLIEL